MVASDRLPRSNDVLSAGFAGPLALFAKAARAEAGFTDFSAHCFYSAIPLPAISNRDWLGCFNAQQDPASAMSGGYRYARQ